jgi:AraC-like DNA-binding protein
LNVRERRLVTIERPCEACLFSDDDVLQLSPGPLDFSSTRVDRPGVRLHRLRRASIADRPGETTVTDIASDPGFSHLGRLSAAYRRQFGELPSDTLRRRPNAT